MKRAAIAGLGMLVGCWSDVTVGILRARGFDAGAPTDLGADAARNEAPEDGTDARDIVDAMDVADVTDATIAVDVVDVADATVATDATDATDSTDALAPCSAGLTRCGDACVDLAHDRLHCGRCDTACRAECVDSECGELLADLSLGLAHTCVRRVDRHVYCWGDNTRGQLGNGSLISRATPAAEIVIPDATQVSAGDWHTCVLRVGGTVNCWGANEAGQLGNGTRRDQWIPRDDGLLHGARTVSVGNAYSCAVGGDGGVICWGYNRYGFLGYGTADDVLTPGRSIDGVMDVAQLSCGPHHMCAQIAGNAWCWGQDGDGALGRGHAVPSSAIPDVVEGLDNVQELGTGDGHTCARLGDGTVWCWGDNSSGQLGSDMPGDSRRPVLVTGLRNIIQLTVAPGQSFSCALDREYTPWCWGNNDRGQLGRGFVGPSGVPGSPARVIGGRTLSLLRAGGQRACGILTNRRQIVCWGWNESGTFGATTPAMSATPVVVPDIPPP